MTATRARRSCIASRTASLIGRFAVTGAILLLSGCTSAPPPKPSPPSVTRVPPEPKLPAPQAPVPAPPVVAAPEVLPELFESDEFIVAFAKSGDSADSLAARYLGTADKAWMIEDYADARSFSSGQEVVIPKRDWNPPGVYPSGYQLVPVLVYHNIAAQRKGRLVISAVAFAEQMRYFKAEGYRAIRLEDFLAHLQGDKQLPKKSVMLTFDDGHKAFLEYARPMLKELGFPAVLFPTIDQIPSRPGPGFLSWTELRALAGEGFDVQPHSKTHRDLRRVAGESESTYATRMRLELGLPLELFRKNLPRLSTGVETIAYPYGEWDEDLLRNVSHYGYVAGFTVRREANSAFVPLLKVHRSQVYADWTLEDLKKNLNTFQRQAILPSGPAASTESLPPAPSGALSGRARLAAPHNHRADQFEARGLLRQALEERKIALTVNPGDRVAQEARDRLESQIETEVTARIKEGLKVAPVAPAEAGRYFLAALALNPKARAAFEALKKAAPPARFLTHTVRSKDTTGSLAALYYGDRSRAEIIEKANGLQPSTPLNVGQVLRIPEISGVPFLRPDWPVRDK
jgi:peptidoglycan/xylan/chitin deacetylase (PgdA/CDA1 family)